MDPFTLAIGVVGGFALASVFWVLTEWKRRALTAANLRLEDRVAAAEHVARLMREDRDETARAYANVCTRLQAIRQQRSDATRRGNVTRANKRRDQHGVNSPVNRELAAGVGR